MSHAVGSVARLAGVTDVAGPRFSATDENIAPGLATYLRDAIRVNAARHG